MTHANPYPVISQLSALYHQNQKTHQSIDQSNFIYVASFKQIKMQFMVLSMCLSSSGVVALHRITHRVTEKGDVIKCWTLNSPLLSVVSRWIEP